MASRNALQRRIDRASYQVRAFLSLPRTVTHEWCGLCGTEITGRARTHVYMCSHCERCYHQDCIDQLRRQEANRGTPLPFGCPGCGTLWYQTSRPQFRENRTSGRYRYRMDGRTFICEGVALRSGQQCGYTTTSSSSFYRHYAREHENQNPQASWPSFCCPYCAQSFETREQMIGHCQAAHPHREQPPVGTFDTFFHHHDTSSSTYRQRDDPWSAARNSHSLRNSGSTYPPAHESQYFCPLCADGPFDYTRVLNHVTTHHVDEQPYCQLCRRSFHAWRYVVRHLHQDH